ncbi:hypothetical protein R1sor_011119 [Riccia sorocarpa]|uniref:Thioredoxin domain-containing protein n=1 Tax=Riccia sorocarpa TaxID=122646 RepID=A0ABD3I0B3_9MARC
MRRWGLAKSVVVVLVLSLALSVRHATAEEEEKKVEDEDDIWEDIEDEESPVLEATRRVSQSALVQVNDRNAEKILKSNEYVMLLGYASWCKQSAGAMIDYAQAALILKEKGSPVILARVDAIVNTHTAKQHGIKGYPTLLFFRNGSSVVYQGGRTSEELVNWIQKHTGHPTTTITTEEEAKEILRRKQTAVVVGYFEEFQGPEYEEFVSASVEVSDVEFVQTTSARAAGFFKSEMAKKVPIVGLFDSEDGFELMEGALTKDAIVAFSNMYKYPMVTKLHTQNVGRVYDSPLKKHVILFAREDDFEDVFEMYKSVAVAFKNKLMFVWVDTGDEDFAKPLMTMYGITESEPVVAGFDNNNGFKYLLDVEEVTKENLMPWAAKFLEGELEVHQKSQRIPSDNAADVKVIVGKTFKSLVLERSTDVVLLITSPYCHDCEAMGKVFAKVAKYFKGNSSLLFGKFDSSLNEHPELRAFNMPSVLYYAVDGSSQEPVIGPVKPFFKKLVRFVEEHWKRQPSTTVNLSKEAEESLDVQVSTSSPLSSDEKIEEIPDVPISSPLSSDDKIEEISDVHGSISTPLSSDEKIEESPDVQGSISTPLIVNENLENSPEVQGSISPSLITDADSGSSEAIPEVSLLTGSKVGDRVTATADSEIRREVDSEDGSVETETGVEPVKADEADLSFETDTPILVTIPEDVETKDSSRPEQGHTGVEDLRKSVSADGPVKANEVDQRKVHKSVSADAGPAESSFGLKDSSADAHRNVDGVSSHAPLEAPAADLSKEEIRVAEGRRDVEDTIADETTFEKGQFRPGSVPSWLSVSFVRIGMVLVWL